MSEPENNDDLWWLAGAALASVGAAWRGLEGEALQATVCIAVIVLLLEQWRLRIRG